MGLPLAPVLTMLSCLAPDHFTYLWKLQSLESPEFQTPNIICHENYKTGWTTHMVKKQKQVYLIGLSGIKKETRGLEG